MSWYTAWTNTAFDAVAWVSAEKVLMWTITITTWVTPSTINPVTDITLAPNRQWFIRFTT
jgi:hypothetical protein